MTVVHVLKLLIGEKDSRYLISNAKCQSRLSTVNIAMNACDTVVARSDFMVP